jgi:hypothetical protein
MVQSDRAMVAGLTPSMKNLIQAGIDCALEPIDFYRRLDYEETSHIGNFCDVGDDRLNFTKRLS